MNHLRNAWGTGLFLMALAVVMQGCGGNSLDGAVYGDQLPVYAAAHLTDSSDRLTTDLGGGEQRHSQSWWLQSSDTRKEIEAWYEQQLPNATRIVANWSDGPVTIYSWAPEGGKPGEELSIVISDEDIQITEVISGSR
jgi:hypothetical protein